ncbi:phospholactate guanylyltransferase [Archaeoglobus sulfaticallidus PM70-1]|uniref:2-phospho-L-lactate guanylyltransferase n=1 Tax=Archaeoglobus sulfaticallidus PM70-1 TaxID=387631 RepID=N0BB94_9EURY|nr:2-phospho-L-lactate guanylyltransferase [Archaeoglobus sulfaticallidus]AGK60278.1 phospholactate guanylyltransferase [Archaeoglobus sulfaticallidus PM70-1]
MIAVVPFKYRNPKTRLAKILSLDERKKLAMTMLRDVLSALSGVDRVTVVVPDDESVKACSFINAKFENAEVVMDDRNLDDLVNYFIDSHGEVAVVMADLPLLNEKILSKFFETDGDVVIAPGRKGGTNMLLVRNRMFRVSYHYGSFMKHLAIAKSRKLKVVVFDSFYSSIDIDDESDILELLIHGEGKESYKFLSSIMSVDCSSKDPYIKRRT